jgi:uncharacterized glyoxalase superfamily protein PhnB
MEIKRLLTNVCSKNLEESKKFYTSLFLFKVDYDSDWFIHLISEGRELELGIVLEQHEIVPSEAQGSASGVYLTFVVEDVDALYQKAKELGCNIQKSPEITFYGQKRMLLVAPEGTVCDVSSPTKA